MKLVLLTVALVASLGSVFTTETCDQMGLYYCNDCWNPPMLCYACSYGRVLLDDYSGCRDCDSFCKTCILDGDGTICEECYDSYVMKDDNSCEACSTYCAQCSLDVDGNQECNECVSRSVLSRVDNANCVPCGSNCASCTVTDDADSLSCTVCDDGYYLDGGSCSSCPTACSSCSLNSEGDKVCSSCFSGYNLNDDASKCIACQSSCNTCVNGASTSSANIAECTSCADGYYLNTDDKPICVGCDTNCATCSGAGLCDSCDPGYYLETSSCLSCPWQCKTCSAADDGSIVCDVCNDQYIVKTGSVRNCDACPSNCVGCTPLQAVNGQCTTCATEYYRDSNLKCQKCPSNCDACDSANGAKCDTNGCQSGYLRDDNGFCRKCADHCSSGACEYNVTTDEASCTSCDSYYAIQDDTTCVQCTGCSSCRYNNGVSDTKCVCSNGADGQIWGSANQYFYRGGCDGVSSTSYVCDAGYYLDPSVNSGVDGCVPCVESGCLHCNSTDDSCLLCDTGSNYAATPMDNGACYACSGISNCESCTYTSSNTAPKNAEQCTACKEGYDIYTDADNNKVCRSCGSLCATCSFTTSGTTVTSSCSSCKASAVQDPDNAANCLACVSPCTSCDVNTDDGTTQCTSGGCPSLYVFNDVDLTCDPCGDNCLTCDYSSDLGVQCTLCDAYYGIKADGTCGSCPYDCITCSIVIDGDGNTDDVLYCDTCSSGYTENDEQCAPCPSKCQSCSADNDGAIRGTVPDTYYYVDSVDLCSKCPSNCQVCTATTCSLCDDGYGLSADKTACTPCATLTKVDRCSLCESARSDGNSTCLSCDGGYVLADNSSYCNQTSLLTNCYLPEDHGPECLSCEENNDRYLHDELKMCVIECITCGEWDYDLWEPTTTNEECNSETGNFTAMPSEICIYGHCGTLLTRDPNSINDRFKAIRGCGVMMYLNTTCEQQYADNYNEDEDNDDDVPNNNGPHLCQEGSSTVETCADCCTGENCNDYYYNSAGIVYASLAVMALALSFLHL